MSKLIDAALHETPIPVAQNPESGKQGVWATLDSAILIANVHAGQAQAKLEQAIEILKKLGVPLVEIHTVSHPDLFPPLIDAAMAKGIKAVIIGGGDGTISSVVDDLLKYDVVMGVLPLGTANDFVRNLGLDPLDLEGACAAIAAGHVEAINLGCANDNFYLNVATVGLGAEVTKQLTPGLKRILGPLSYPVAGIRTFFRYRPFRLRLTLEKAGGKKVVHTFRALQVAVANGRYHGGGMVAAPKADLKAPHLSVAVYGAMGPFALGRVLLALRHGTTPRSNKVRFYQTDCVTVETPRHTKTVNVDGELCLRTPVTFTLSESAIRVFTVPQVPSDTDELH